MTNDATYHIHGQHVYCTNYGVLVKDPKKNLLLILEQAA